MVNSSSVAIVTLLVMFVTNVTANPLVDSTTTPIESVINVTANPRPLLLTYTMDIPITPIVTDETTTKQSGYCFPVAWNPVGNVIARGGAYEGLAVDDDGNVYVENAARRALEKWSPNGELIKSYFDGNFDAVSPLFFHSPSQSLYFCYMWEAEVGVYKFDGGNSKPVKVLGNPKNGIYPYNTGNACSGLYVTAAGDIFILVSPYGNVMKWTTDNSSGILVADGHKYDSVTDSRSGSIDVLAVDEINDLIYILDRVGPRILKYNRNSPIGTAIFDASQKEIFSDVPPTPISTWALVADKTGNILLGNNDEITMFTSDGKFNVTVVKEYQTSQDNTKQRLVCMKMAFDKVGNLYVHEAVTSRVIKFNRMSTACTNTAS